MEGKDSGDESDGQVPDTISYHIPTAPSTPFHDLELRSHQSIPPTPRTPLHDHEVRTHRSIYWNGLTGMQPFEISDIINIIHKSSA